MKVNGSACAKWGSTSSWRSACWRPLTCSGRGAAGIGVVGRDGGGGQPRPVAPLARAHRWRRRVCRPLPPAGGSDLHARARKVDRYLANYGSWDANSVAVAKRAQLAIVHPDHAELTRAQVADIQAGVDPNDPSDDVLVLCYVSVGEDLRAAPLSDDAVRANPRFRGDGTGPRIDPRGADADGHVARRGRSAGRSFDGWGGIRLLLPRRQRRSSARRPSRRRFPRPQSRLRIAVRQRRGSELVRRREQHEDGQSRPPAGTARGSHARLRSRARLRRRLLGYRGHGRAEQLHQCQQPRRKRVRMDGARL